MQPAEIGKRLGVFLAVLVVVGAGVTALTGGGGVAPAGDGAHPVDVATHSSADVIAEQPAEEGQVTMDAETEGKVVVIDVSHTTRVDEFDLRTVVDALSRNGHEVRIHEGGRSEPGRLLNASLRPADALLVVAPTQRFTTDEANGVAAFTEAGGRMAVLAEPEGQSAASVLGVPVAAGSERAHAELAPVASRLSVSVGSGYLYDIEDNVNNVADIGVTPVAEGPLTEGVERVVVHEATPVTGSNVLLRTDESAELSTTRRADGYGVAVRSHNVTVVGDSSLLAPEWVYLGDNEVFVGNLLDFLVTGEKAPSNTPRPAGPPAPPRGR